MPLPSNVKPVYSSSVSKGTDTSPTIDRRKSRGGGKIGDKNKMCRARKRRMATVMLSTNSSSPRNTMPTAIFSLASTLRYRPPSSPRLPMMVLVSTPKASLLPGPDFLLRMTASETKISIRHVVPIASFLYLTIFSIYCTFRRCSSCRRSIYTTRTQSEFISQFLSFIA